MGERIYEETRSGKIIPKEGIIRCKDCKHGTGWNKASDGTVLGECNYIYIGIEQMGFCPYGEHKDN